MRRTIVILLSAAGLLAAQPAYDLVLKGGHVIDPKNHIDAVMDVAVSGGKIARVAPGIPAADARQTVDAAGLYVTPGLIDIHAHVFEPCDLKAPAHAALSVQPDAFSFRSGVTTMVDAGTSGWKTFPEFRERIIRRSSTRVLALLNIVGAGMGSGKEDDPAEMDPVKAAETAKANADIIVGFKSAHYAGPGWESVDNAVKAGRMADMPVMIDFGQLNEVRNLDTLLRDKLRPGDIYTHCYSGHREELLDNNRVNPAMIAGRKRGIIFDLGHGSGSFYWYVAVPFFQQGFYPDSISTDLHTGSMNGGMKDMTNVMSKVLNLGVPLAEVIRMSTWNPAQEIKKPQLGTLDVGAEADIAVLRVDRGHYGFLDSTLARKDGTRLIVCELTLRKGAVAWDLNGRASLDWQKYPYHRKKWTGQTAPSTAH
ncbi:MAG TPA: amidohydrolase/deacetylase family metallohydrolase [Bryobacteraceae bacterium]|nr:amidohydrolase/deacetylase family metallohydrolase [Bryobacteraceae bacterium]